MLILRAISIFFLLVGIVASTTSISSADTQTIEYGNEPIVDHDLDGLTDLGEGILFHTDSNLPDTDYDGFLDGVEILHKTDPLNPLSPGSALYPTPTPESPDPAWAWYISRATGLIAFALLYISMFLALLVRTPGLKKIAIRFKTLPIHYWLSVHALIFVIIHAISLTFDKYFFFTLTHVLVPFTSPYQTNLVSLGILGFYIMIILILTSYARRYLPYRFWRTIHFLNIVLYIIIIIHALLLGTDLASEKAKIIFLSLNALLILLIIVNHVSRLIQVIRGFIRSKTSQPPTPPFSEA